MAEQLSSSASVSASDSEEEVVKIPMPQYKRAIAQMRQQKYQLVAASNLHRLMREKEEELMASKEENKQLQLSLQQSETRLTSMMRLQAAAAAATNVNAATHVLEEDCAYEKCSFLRSDVETDCENATLPQQNFPQCSSLTKLTAKPPYKSMMSDSNTVTEIPVTLRPVTSPSACASSASTDTCTANVTCSASSITVTAQSYMSPVSSVTLSTNPESKDLLDKVLQQNARLKKTLRDLLSQKGLSVSTYLDKQEYEDAAEILRHDLAEAQKRISQLKSIIASRNSGDIDQVTQECARLTDKVAILERKLAISQAYADALKQAHDKCREGGSHVETNSEAASAALSANYAQALEELQIVKDHCKDCERKNETLQSDLEELQQENKVNKESLSELHNLKHEHQLLLEQQHLLQSQIAAYEEDFKTEQREKQQLQENNEINIAKHQEWVRRLAVEAEKCRASWQEEIAKREELEHTLKSIQSGHMSPSDWSSSGHMSSSDWSSSKCSSPLNPKPTSSTLPGVVGADGPPDDSEKRRTDCLVCPRCEREFRSTEKPKWELHCKRCTDD